MREAIEYVVWFVLVPYFVGWCAAVICECRRHGRSRRGR